jgi:hypothetical protein
MKMDPNETLARIVQHLVDGNAADARLHLGFLETWLAGGGFRPEMAKLIELLERREDGR